jgi:hypothetical protein
MRTAAAFALFLAGLAVSPGAEPSDLDELMARVLSRRDENWKKLQQYVLDERESLDLIGPGGARLYGFRRDYTWFLREGVFVRSPLRADGVTLTDDQRRAAERDWLASERRREEREKRRAMRAAEAAPADPPAPDSPASDATPVKTGDPTVTSLTFEPAFVSHAYFLRFKFEKGQYALAGRETLEGRPVLKIEYYPTLLFNEGRTRPNRRVRERDDEIEEKMNKVSLVTLWVDPELQQILQYTFDDIDMDFLPGRALVRVDDLKATMRMGQPFPAVWLPRDVEMRFRMTLAVGPVDARYRVEYHDYRQADVTYKIR